MPKHRRQQAAFLTEAPIRSLFARKIRNALLVNAAVLAALRAKENVWCPATMLTALIPEVVAAATVAWSIFSVRLARARNTRPLLRVSLAVAQGPAPRKQIAEKRVWSVARASALSRDANPRRISAGQEGFRFRLHFTGTFAPCFTGLSAVADVYLLTTRTDSHCGSPIRRTSPAKRGSERMLSHVGSTLSAVRKLERASTALPSHTMAWSLFPRIE